MNVSADLLDEVVDRPLQIEGEIPAWLSGSLVRNGPVNVIANGEKNGHWFDGLAMLHAFSFHKGTVQYTNKFLRTDAYRKVFEEGSIHYSGFAYDPCRTLFKRFLTLFFPKSHPDLHNANVNVAKYANAYIAMTETPLPVRFDRQTLDTLGVFDYQDQLPKDKCWESAHPHYDASQKRTWNYLVKFGKNSFYTLYYLRDGSANREILAEIPVQEPAYMHSFAITENYLILAEFPYVVKPLDLILKGKAFIKNYSWKPQKGTIFRVIDRNSGNEVGQYRTRPFFAFHHANAFEKDGKIILDIVAYQDAGIIDDINNSGTPSQLERFSVSLENGEISSEVLFSDSNEFPRINEKFAGLPYRYAYVAGFSGSEGLHKVDTETKKTLSWLEAGCSVGEPIFVASPGAKEEDDGVVLSLILNRTQNSSFLLVLNAKNFQELGRAKAPHLIPDGLHAQYFP